MQAISMYSDTALRFAYEQLDRLYHHIHSTLICQSDATATRHVKAKRANRSADRVRRRLLER